MGKKGFSLSGVYFTNLRKTSPEVLTVLLPASISSQLLWPLLGLMAIVEPITG